ncbi:carboxypeptidase-like regulatory domain-containing protein [Croceivirga radicis]|uniref:carboxypeptidase-like regulatory domain-containing protein n=1 Tax=Croceivirga radicis TaxID=1929488 RepID=UPI0009B2324A|nr:carboxypeptidase-like regulatory domain-containing protein [Croceivirga radicis]
MKYVYATILLFTHLSINSQVLKGVVFDSISKENLQYVNISFKNKEIGTFSTNKGAYSLDLSRATNKDSLLISLIGYQTKTIALASYIAHKESILNVALTPKIEALNEVIVFDGKEQYETKALNFKTGKRKTLLPISVPFGYETATFIENKSKKKGRLIEVNIKLKDVSKEKITIHKTFYRLSFYKANSLGYPGKALLYDNIIIKPKKGVNEYQIDLANKYVAFDENGIFISLETIKPDTVEASGSMYVTTPNIVHTHTDESLTYTRFGQNKWYKNNHISAFKKKLYNTPYLVGKVIYKKNN